METLSIWTASPLVSFWCCAAGAYCVSRTSCEHCNIAMWKRCIGVSLRLVVGLVLMTNMTIAQDRTDVPRYLNFEQFKTVVNADDLGFFGTLRYAGMQLVHAPAAKRVSSFYEYEAKSITDSECSNDKSGDDYALLMNWGVNFKEIEGTPLYNNLLNIKREGKSTEENLRAVLKNRDWVPIEILFSYNKEEGNKIISEFEPIPIWHEMKFDNSCDLKRSIMDRNDIILTWKPVLNDKLKKIGKDQNKRTAYSTYVIVTEPISDVENEVEYLVECEDTDSVPVPDISLCNRLME